MDFKFKRLCPNCSQYFSLPSDIKTVKICRIPLTLQCGHPICKNCLMNIIKHSEPIECKICHTLGTLPDYDAGVIIKKPHFIYETFPIHVHILGELSARVIENTEKSQMSDDRNCFIDIRSILDRNKNFADCSNECARKTNMMCQNCNVPLCESCFTQIHTTIQSFKKHVYKTIDLKLEPNTCPVHGDKPINYYCKNCSKSCCIDCVMAFGNGDNCKDHHLVPINQMQTKFLDELKSHAPKVNETLRHLSNTAVHIGHTLKSFEQSSNTSQTPKLIVEVQHHFAKLYATVQKHEHETISVLERMKNEEMDSLLKAKENVFANLNTTQNVIDKISAALAANDIEQVNLSRIVDAAKDIEKIPWYLQKSQSEKNIKVTVKEELCYVLQNYASVEGEFKDTYSLVPTDEIVGDVPPAPPTIVYPPQLPRDVRELAREREAKQQIENKKPPLPHTTQTVPKFKPKFGSTSSVNSSDSVNSHSTVKEIEIKPKSLRKGIQELIYISHINDPHDFYVQLSSDQSLVKDMINTYRNSKHLPVPLASDIQEGTLMLGYCEEEKKWYRCNIISKDKKNSGKTLYGIFYIDFGINDLVTLNQLRLLPPTQAQKAPLAYHCKLANLQPINQKWTSADAMLIQKIVDNKQSIIHVHEIKQISNESMYVCDLVTFDEGVNIALALVFHGRATLVNNKLAFPHIKTMEEKPRIFHSTLEYNNNDLYDVFITHIINPDHFYVRKICTPNSYLELSEHMASHYNLKSQKDLIHCPFVGMVCVVNVDGYDTVSDRGWRRAKILKLCGEQKVSLLLVDTGEQLVAHVSFLRRIHSRFTTRNALAIECQLNAITPLNKKWSESSLQLFRKFINKRLQMRVVHYENNSLSVILYAMSENNELICINQEMVKKHFAVTIGVVDFNLPEEHIPAHEITIAKPASNERKQNQITILKRDPKKDVKYEKPLNSSTDFYAKDKGPIKLEVDILDCESPSLLYVSLKDQQRKMKDLYSAIQEFYFKKSAWTKSDWNVGDKCCAKCIQSKTWRRARIIDLNNDEAKLMFVDFAIIENMPLSELRVLLPEFQSERDAALKCHLSGIMPGAGDKWPLLTIQHLKDRLTQYHRFFITKKGVVKDGSLPIEVWVYHITQGGALEPNTAEWRCLNKDIIVNGLAIPDGDNEMTKAEEDEDSLSFLDLTGSVNDWILLETVPKELKESGEKENSKKEEAVQGTSKDSVEPDNSLMQTQADENIDTSDWLPATSFSSKTFNATVTYVDTSCVLYLHEKSQEDTLLLLRSALENIEAEPGELRDGALCLARFFADGQLYRAKLISTRPYNCRACFVDYGNIETCSPEDIILLTEPTAIHKIPIQAHKCVLAHIKPTSGTWRNTTLQYIHQILVDKKSYVKIVGDPIGEYVPIELKLEDKFWLHEHLIEFRLAERTDDWMDDIRNLDNAIIVDETEATESASSFRSTENVNTTKDSSDIHKDWNALMDNESESDAAEEYIPVFKEISFEKTLRCTVKGVTMGRIIALKLVQDEKTEAQYVAMMDDIQKRHEQRPGINGIYENKACIALSKIDKLWHRASIHQYSEDDKIMRMKFIDCGRSEIISVSNVKEIDDEWLELPPAMIVVQPHDVELNIAIESSKAVIEFSNFLHNNTFDAKVIETGELPVPVELYKIENGELAYNELLESGLLVKKDKTTYEEKILGGYFSVTVDFP